MNQLLKLDKVIKEMAEDKDLIALVKSIEGSIKTTQNHYGRYMPVLSMAKNKLERYVISESLKMAGANSQGVNSALRVLEV